MRMRVTVAIAVLACMTLPAAHAAPAVAIGQDAAALKALRERYARHLVNDVNNRPGVDSKEAGEFLATQAADGSWPDVNYSDRSATGWAPELHMQRLMSMAAAYNTPGGPHHQSAAMLDGIRRGLTYWEQAAPHSTNPHRRRIGTPNQLGVILVLMYGKIDPAMVDRFVKGMSAVVVDGGYSRRAGSGGHRESGADVVSGARVHIAIGLMTHDAEAIAIASRHIQAEARPAGRAGDAGLQDDGAYHYHGPQIHYPGYSEGHAQNTIVFADLFAGTPWAFDEGPRVFLHDAVEGMGWLLRRGCWDPFIMGRAISRKVDDGGRHRSDLAWVERLKRVNPDHAELYQAIADHQAGKNDAAVVGNRHFWLSDYMSHRRENFMLSVRIVSTRTSRQEAGNDENIQNRYLSQGATAILVNGDEYDDIYPVWDWTRIPGTTAPNSTGRRVLHAGNWGARGSTDFVGGVSDGMHGVATMDVDWHDGNREASGPEHRRSGRIYAHKNWFFFDREMVALGSGIRYDGQFAPVETTLNQALRKSPVFSNRHPAGNGEPETEAATLEGLQWVWHAEVGYVFPHSQKVILRNESQVTGGWRGINNRYENGDLITKDRFTLSIDHGEKPDAESYAYIVVPGVSRQQFDAYRQKQDEIRILINTPQVAAVHHAGRKLTGLVIRDPEAAGTVRVHDSLSVSASAAAIVLIDESVSPMQVTVGAPTEREVTITLTTATGQQALSFEVPGTRSVTKPVN